MSAYLSVNECAELLAVEHKTVRRLIDRGELPALRVGRVLRIDPADLESLRYQPRGDAADPPTSTRPRPAKGEYSRRSREVR